VVLGRIFIIRVSSGFLNIGSCSKGEPLFSVIKVGAYVTGSLCFHPVGVGTLRELVLPSSG